MRRGCVWLAAFYTVPTNCVPSQSLAACLALAVLAAVLAAAALLGQPPPAVLGMGLQSSTDLAAALKAQVVVLAARRLRRADVGVEGGLACVGRGLVLVLAGLLRLLLPVEAKA